MICLNSAEAMEDETGVKGEYTVPRKPMAVKYMLTVYAR